MRRLILRRVFAAALFVVLLMPAAASAQSAIAGVVRDASGGVLPGVSVEASSPALLEARPRLLRVSGNIKFQGRQL